ncbi:hypothetical protein DV737_g3089, partial [Chaetothyriales sp. CBS 132003]
MARGLHAPAPLRRSPLPALRVSPLIRPRAPAIHHTRAIWWWGRQRTDWTPHHDECLEERLRIYQRILRHRSSKMLRRRAMWEREAIAPASSWPWRMPGRLIGQQLQNIQNLSSTTATRAKVEQHSEESAQHRPVATFDRDFDSFKKAVDEAVQKDAYGALFGRRLQGPDSANNSSWTSFSWIWDPKTINQDPADSQSAAQPPKQTAPPPPPPITPARTSPSPEPVARPIPSRQSGAEEEYEYDPISMRRMPKSKRNKFLSLFFYEHNLDLTPALYEPKVYGYVDKSVDKAKDSKSSKSAATLNTSESFESSRQHRFRDLRAATLGNAIVTAAEFSEKFSPPEESSAERPKRKPREEAEEPSDDAPLFSGTTYETKSADILASRRSASQPDLPRAEPFTPSAEGASDNIPVKKFSSRIETSLDRMMPKNGPASSFTLQPALDRHLQTRDPDPTQSVNDALADKTVDEVETAASMFSGKLENVWKQAKRNPTAIVAKTITSLGLTHTNASSPCTNIEPVDLTSSIVKANLHEDIVEGAQRTLTERDEAAKLASGTNKTDEEDHDSQQPLDAGQPLHPLSTATVKPGVPRYPVVDAHVSNFEPRFAKLIDSAKDAKRQIHEAQLHCRHLKHQIQGLSEPGPDEAAAAGPPSFAMLKEDPVEDPSPQSLDGPFAPAAAGIDTTSDHVPASVSQSVPPAQGPVSISSDASVSDHEQPSPASNSVEPPQPLSAPYVVLRYNSSQDIVRLVSMSEPPPNDGSNLDAFNRLDHAAKFFSFFPTLLKQGYEVASGGQDYVLFKRGNSDDGANANVDPVVDSAETSSPSETISASAAPRLAQPPMSPAAAARLKEYQDLTSTYISLNDVKHSHGLNNFEIHSVLSQLAASVRTGKQEGAEGLGGTLDKLKILRSKARTMDPVEFNKQVDELIREVQIARAAVPIKQVTPTVPPFSSTETEPGEAQKMYAATVLDKIPAPIPTPGPAAPTAPPSGPTIQPVLIRRQPAESPESTSQPKAVVHQQNQSSTLAPTATTSPSEAQTEPDPRTSQLPLSPSGLGPRARLHARLASSPPVNDLDESGQQSRGRRQLPSHEFKSGAEGTAPKTSAFRRFTRLVRRTILAIIGAGVGAYVVGMIAESVGAEAQKASVGEEGPRKKVVLPPPPAYRQRPGIFSTESSR